MKTKTIIDLNNNYYLKIINNDDLPIEATDIEQLRLIKLIKTKKLLLKIDFTNLDKTKYKKVLKKLLLVKNIILRSKIKIGIQENSKIILGYVINYDQTNELHNNFILAVDAIFLEIDMKDIIIFTILYVII